MENIFVMDKALMGTVIETLKLLDVRGFDSYDKLVGCVMLLTNAMNNTLPEKDGGDKVDG